MPTRRTFAAALSRALLILTACVPLAHAPAVRAAVEEVAVVTTPQGEITWRFFEKEAPGHVAYVKELIRRGFYDGTTFHRVIPHFVIQGGDPNSKNDDRSDDGEGEADHRLKAEFSTTLHYRPGTVGMARDADPDSGSCQYFIALENIPRLDGRYTIFGEVVSGLDVARRIAELPRDLRDNPIERVPVTVRIERREVPKAIVSIEAGESGETVTGPSKPKPYDPGNVLWKAPVLRADQKDSPLNYEEVDFPKLEVVVGTDGKVLDVRFPSLETPDAAALRAKAMQWSFQPAGYDGKPAKARFEMESDGTEIGPPTGPGSPLEMGAGVHAPVPSPRVELPKGRKAPAKPSRIRLTIDETGAVTEADLQASCGDEDLDTAAVDAARRMIFTPASRVPAGGREAEPTPVHLNVETRFVEPG